MNVIVLCKYSLLLNLVPVTRAKKVLTGATKDKKIEEFNFFFFFKFG